MKIILTTPKDSADYEIIRSNGVNKNGTVTAGTIVNDFFQRDINETISIKASEVVQVIVFSNYMQGSSAAFLAIPQIKNKIISKYSYAIGADMNNSVTVATCNTYTYVKISYLGEILSSVSTKNVLSPLNDFNLKGLQVEATNPLGFVTNNICNNDLYECVEHITEQIPPSYTWGYNFFVVPFQNGSGYMIKVWQRFEGTNFTIYCTSGSEVTKNRTVSNLQFNEINNTNTEFILDADSYCCIQSNRPFAVMQYSYISRFSTNNSENSTVSVWIAPVSQYLNKHVFSTDVYNNSDQQMQDEAPLLTSEVHYIIVTVRTKFDPTDILLNGKPLECNLSKWYNITCSSNDICGYGISINVNVSNYTINHANSDASFNVIVYGWKNELDHEKGYAYPAGFGMKPVGGKLVK